MQHDFTAHTGVTSPLGPARGLWSFVQHCEGPHASSYRLEIQYAQPSLDEGEPKWIHHKSKERGWEKWSLVRIQSPKKIRKIPWSNINPNLALRILWRGSFLTAYWKGGFSFLMSGRQKSWYSLRLLVDRLWKGKRRSVWSVIDVRVKWSTKNFMVPMNIFGDGDASFAERS